MLTRRKFLALSGAAGVLPLAAGSIRSSAEDAKPAERDCFLLQQYQVADEAQKKRLDDYIHEAAIPALNRAGIRPVGVFYPQEGLSPVYVLLRHKSSGLLLNLVAKLLADEEFVRKGADAIDATAANPAFKRLESSLLIAFTGMPELAAPAKTPGRVFQLRMYESPSLKTAKKKIEMFNDAGEIKIFRRVGLNPVFFGETLVGGKMPNLTYMLTFESRKDQDDAWGRFSKDADWQKLRAMPEYADKTILCGITNLLLKPAEYSQI